MRCKIFIILFTAALVFPIITKAETAPDSFALLENETAAWAYVVVDISSNSTIAQKNSNQVYPIASITKLMNAVVAVENIDLDTSITLNSKMLKLALLFSQI